jgi:hypothetical protein
MAGHSVRPIGAGLVLALPGFDSLACAVGPSVALCRLYPSTPFSEVRSPPWLGRGIVDSERPNDLLAPATY